jgi:hypothetical protein
LDIVEGSASSEMKEDVKSTGLRKEDDGGTPGPVRILSGKHLK